MATGGDARKKIDWGAMTLAFNLFVLVIGGLMAYAYFNGQTTTAVANNSRRLDTLEVRIERVEAAIRSDRGRDHVGQ